MSIFFTMIFMFQEKRLNINMIILVNYIGEPKKRMNFKITLLMTNTRELSAGSRDK